MEQKPISELLKLTGKTSIVTGGALGIGFGIASRLAEAGANVVIADLKPDAANASAEKLTNLGFKTTAVATDVSKEPDVTRMVEQTVQTFGSVDILVNNAGIYPNQLIMNMTAADFHKVLAVNLLSVFMTTKAVSEIMIKQGKGGKIINITSIDALHPSSAGLAHYDASKHGLWGFTKNSALELAQHKIQVNAIAPGGITTEGTQEIQKSMQLPAGVNMEKLLENFMAKIPMKRMGDPDDIGKVALFLASDMSSYMTGSQIVVDGGVLLS